MEAMKSKTKQRLRIFGFVFKAVPIAIALVAGCAAKARYSFSEFLQLPSFQAKVTKVLDLPGSVSIPTNLSGPDIRFYLRTESGKTVIVERIPTSLGGQFCGTVNSLQNFEKGQTYIFPEALRPKPDCTEPFSK